MPCGKVLDFSTVENFDNFKNSYDIKFNHYIELKARKRKADLSMYDKEKILDCLKLEKNLKIMQENEFRKGSDIFIPCKNFVKKFKK